MPLRNNAYAKCDDIASSNRQLPTVDLVRLAEVAHRKTIWLRRCEYFFLTFSDCLAAVHFIDLTV